MEIQYLKRNIDEILISWSLEKPPDRKPLLLRGARQVGKSSALRQLGKQFNHFVEINFDENKEARSFFEGSLSPQEICQQLALFERGIRTSLENFGRYGDIDVYPLYAVGNVAR